MFLTFIQAHKYKNKFIQIKKNAQVSLIYQP